MNPTPSTTAARLSLSFQWSSAIQAITMKNVACTYTSIPAIRASFQDHGMAMSLSIIVPAAYQPDGDQVGSVMNLVPAGPRSQDDAQSSTTARMPIAVSSLPTVATTLTWRSPSCNESSLPAC